jgi:hypothetical protein
MKYKVGDIVQFEKDCVLPAGGSIAAGSRWRVKEVEENYYELWYRDEHLPDMTERIEYKLVDDCCEKINTAPSITKRINDKSDAINGQANSDAIKPDYYQFHGYDVFDIAEHFGLSFPLGNALKYLLRAGKKDSATWEQDLSKCKKCIERAMEMKRSE